MKFSQKCTLAKIPQRRKATEWYDGHIPKTVKFSDELRHPTVEVNNAKLDVTKLTRASVPTRLGILSRKTIRSTIREVNVKQRQQFSVNYNKEWYKSAESDIFDARLRTKQWKFKRTVRSLLKRGLLQKYAKVLCNLV